MTNTPEQDIPDDAQEQLRAAIDTALSQPKQAQGFLTKIPDLSGVGGVKDSVVDVLDKVIDAIDVALQYKWIIPDQYEKPLQALVDALTKVRGWVD
jgi:hypothetical protein